MICLFFYFKGSRLSGNPNHISTVAVLDTVISRGQTVQYYWPRLAENNASQSNSTTLLGPTGVYNKGKKAQKYMQANLPCANSCVCGAKYRTAS